ncbi:protein kinase domain-containing protein [Humibacter sp.]|uniref:protein kinase domain-containing protein n=1 Tax=Humibacter sp. TaxID=1940291 RepID=UPI003F7E9475
MTDPQPTPRLGGAVATGPTSVRTGGAHAGNTGDGYTGDGLMTMIADPATDGGLQSVPGAMGGRPPSRYTITGTLGEGGMSVVYSAIDEHLGREVAVKVFKHAISGDDSTRQEAEIDVLAGLSHHAIVTLIDAGIAPDPQGAPHRYLVLERVDGVDLRRHLEGTQLSLRHIAEIGCDLAEALEYVHARGVIHRDLTPGNVLVVSDENGRTRARLTDFGIALATGAERATMEGVTTGTAAYLSPEQARGDTLTGASDVYALGLVLLECHTRTLTFPGTPVQSALARLTSDPVIPDDLPDAWRMLLAAMTSRDPADRPVGRELVQALRQLELAESSRHRAAPAGTVSEPSLAHAFDRITGIAARTFGVPVAVLSMVRGDNVRFLSHRGVSPARASEWEGVCTSAAFLGETLLVEDAAIDPRVRDHILVTGEARLRFYAAVPVHSVENGPIGTLCVADTTARPIEPAHIDTLRDLADLAALVLGWDADARRMPAAV